LLKDKVAEINVTAYIRMRTMVRFSMITYVVEHQSMRECSLFPQCKH